MLMEAKARGGMTLTALLATSMLMLLSGAPIASADGRPLPVTQTPASTKTSGQVITVSVWGDVSGRVGGGFWWRRAGGCECAGALLDDCR
jgi:hypothetical protein